MTTIYTDGQTNMNGSILTAEQAKEYRFIISQARQFESPVGTRIKLMGLDIPRRGYPDLDIAGARYAEHETNKEYVHRAVFQLANELPKFGISIHPEQSNKQPYENHEEQAEHQFSKNENQSSDKTKVRILCTEGTEISLHYVGTLTTVWIKGYPGPDEQNSEPTVSQVVLDSRHQELELVKI